MRHTWTRNGAAARLFIGFGVGLLVIALATGSVALAVVAVVAFVAAVASTRGFPLDRNW